ncbi:MAG: PfkB family carbohydrate kinase [Pseudomonadota bacterium]
MIVTCGEALVDLMPEMVDGALMYRPVLGGSLYTVALGIARLGGSSGYLWELSCDALGQRFRAELDEAGVDCTAVRTSQRASPVAVVDMSGPEPRYNIADPDGVMVDTALPDLPDHTTCLQIGSAVLARDPVGAAIESLAEKAPFLTIDYNVRAPSIVDREAYCARLRRIASSSGIVKASVADIGMLGEGDPEAYMEDLIAMGATAAVLTKGGDGASIRTARAHAHTKTRAHTVTDPVGAGDSFMAALLYRLQADGALFKEKVCQYREHELAGLIDYAQAAAAFTCARKGAIMPRAENLVEHM